MQSSIVKALIELIKSGKFSSPPSKVVLLVHSLGSVICNGALNTDPGLVDAAILTGVAYTTSGAVPTAAKQLRLARLKYPKKWGHLDGGWAFLVDMYSNMEE
jgi:alpha-beta hydrolase superfamily lysophospholipase